MPTSTLKIGCHLSIADGYLAAAKTAVSIGANTFQVFSRNPRGGSARAVDAGDIAQFLRYAGEHGLLPVLAHAPYTLNAASSTEATREFAESCMSGDLKTLRLLCGAANYTFHPGSHTGTGMEEGIGHLVGLLNRILVQPSEELGVRSEEREINWVSGIQNLEREKKDSTRSVPSAVPYSSLLTPHSTLPNHEPRILLETMSGKGSEIGADFSQLRQIIDGVTHNEDLGVCMDTCHVFAAGYDIAGDLDDVLEQFDREVGLSRLKAVHLNDSMMPFGSRKDRHAKIGEGLIGADALVRFVNHPALRHLPFYLETPNELDGYAAEIAFFRDNFSA
ncbi:MAG: deoxyribonuclease IV [Firmicutes bacterium]|nr:deoxyribonuclease IV [Bacillota bacterium]